MKILVRNHQIFDLLSPNCTQQNACIRNIMNFKDFSVYKLVKIGQFRGIKESS